MQKLRDFDPSKSGVLGWHVVGAEPELVESLLDSLREAAGALVGWYENVRQTEEAVLCLWAGKRTEGRKGEQDGEGEPSQPWVNASDAEVRKVMELALSHRDVCLTAGLMAQWDMVSGVGPEDAELAKKVKALLRYYHARLMPEAPSQESLWAFWGAAYGVAGMGMEWRKEVRLVPEEWSIGEVLAVLVPEAEALAEEMEVEVLDLLTATEVQDVGAAEVIAELQAVAQVLADGKAWRDGVRLLREAFPEVTAQGAATALKSLRAEGRARLPVKKLGEDRPEWKALIPGDHWFFPANVRTGFHQSSPWHAFRKLMTEEELRAMVEHPQGDLAWDETWVDAVVEKTRGVCLAPWLREARAEMVVDGAMASRVSSSKEGDAERFEIFEFWYRARDEMGCHGLYRMVVSPHLGTSRGLVEDEVPVCGWHGLSPSGTNYPVVPYVFVEMADTLLDNRGLGAVARDKQGQLKALMDQCVDAVDIKMRPPVIVPLRDVRQPHEVRPGGRIPESTQGSARFANVNIQGHGEAMQIMQVVNGAANALAGLEHELVAPALSARRQGIAAGAWLAARAQLMMGTLELAQTYAERVTVLRVTRDMAGPFSLDREEFTQASFDLQFVWDPRSLNGEEAAALLKTIQTVLPMDRMGILDWATMLQDVLALVSPLAGDRWLTDRKQATSAEEREEKQELNQVLNGIEGTYAGDKGQNPQLRLNVMMTLEQSPGVAKRLQADEDVAKLWEKRKQHFQFLMQQEQNAVIGREIGVKPDNLVGQG